MAKPGPARLLCALLGLAVAALALTAAKKPPPLVVTHAVTIDATSYQPSTTVVELGEAVVFRNDDLFRHTATTAAGGFDSKDIPAGASWRFTPRSAGRYDFACVYHTTMKGTLVVR